MKLSIIDSNQPRPGQRRQFIPSFAIVKEGLQIEEADLDQPWVRVNGGFLKFLLTEFARTLSFDEDSYARIYPDVEVAHLAGRIDDLHDHFVTNGWFEDRLPCLPRIDAEWYVDRYDDLRELSEAGQTIDVQKHYVGSGFAEGRAQSAKASSEAERWQDARIASVRS